MNKNNLNISDGDFVVSQWNKDDKTCKWIAKVKGDFDDYKYEAYYGMYLPPTDTLYAQVWFGGICDAQDYTRLATDEEIKKLMECLENLSNITYENHNDEFLNLRKINNYDTFENVYKNNKLIIDSKFNEIFDIFISDLMAQLRNWSNHIVDYELRQLVLKEIKDIINKEKVVAISDMKLPDDENLKKLNDLRNDIIRRLYFEKWGKETEEEAKEIYDNVKKLTYILEKAFKLGYFLGEKPNLNVEEIKEYKNIYKFLSE